MTDGPTDGPEIQIELGDISYKTAGRKRRPDHDRSLAIVQYGRPDGEQIPVFIHEQVLQGIESHGASNTTVELGGALLGGFYRDGDRQFVEITDFIIAGQAEHSAAQITFTHETWAEIDAEREARAPDAQIVGWYHTHPDLGVFLSEPDTFIQRNFFKEPWQVALVIDPVQGDRGFFQPKRGVLLRAEGFYVVTERSRRKALQAYVDQLQMFHRRMREPQGPASMSNSGSASGSASMAAWLVILTLLFFAVLVLEGIRGRPLFSPPPPGVDQRASEFVEMGEFEEAERMYAEALIEKPRDVVLARKFAAARERAEKLPEISQPRQERFIKWFLSQADRLAARGDYETTERLYNAAGVRVNPKEGAKLFNSERDAAVLAAYRYLADRERPAGQKRDQQAETDQEGVLRMQTDLKRSWDKETVEKIRAGLKHLIAEQPRKREEMQKALKSLEKEYLLRPEGARN